MAPVAPVNKVSNMKINSCYVMSDTLLNIIAFLHFHKVDSNEISWSLWPLMEYMEPIGASGLGHKCIMASLRTY